MQMNFAGSSIGACRRAADAGIVTDSLMEATASALATPPSMKARVDGGTSAAAISRARTTPRAVRVVATLAVRSTMRSPSSAPRRGGWPFVENRTSFMGERLPTEMYPGLWPFRTRELTREEFAAFWGSAADNGV